jgi:simple sugar transport system substrate-binding protein
MKIVFFPGGTEGGGFETVVYNGAKMAEAAFGPKVAYQWSDWENGKMISQFQEALASHPDGIAVMGHPGDDAFDPLIDQAREQGILVTVMNTELPAAQDKYATEGTGYVGAVLYDAEGRVFGVIALDVADGVVQTIRGVVNPDKLGHIGPVSDVARLPEKE